MQRICDTGLGLGIGELTSWGSQWLVIVYCSICNFCCKTAPQNLQIHCYHRLFGVHGLNSFSAGDFPGPRYIRELTTLPIHPTQLERGYPRPYSQPLSTPLASHSWRLWWLMLVSSFSEAKHAPCAWYHNIAKITAYPTELWLTRMLMLSRFITVYAQTRRRLQGRARQVVIGYLRGANGHYTTDLNRNQIYNGGLASPDMRRLKAPAATGMRVVSTAIPLCRRLVCFRVWNMSITAARYDVAKCLIRLKEFTDDTYQL